MSARDEVLLRGLIDWVALSSVHGAVEQENSGEPLAVVQDKVLDLIRSLVVDGLFELGDLATRKPSLWRLGCSARSVHPADSRRVCEPIR